jgi:ribosomal protein L17
MGSEKTIKLSLKKPIITRVLANDHINKVGMKRKAMHRIINTLISRARRNTMKETNISRVKLIMDLG